VAGRFLVLGYLADPDLVEPMRVGIITTRKIGGAVVRNRVRRRLRGILQRTGDRVIPGHWLVFVARSSAASATTAQLEKEWKWMLRKASLLRSEPARTESPESPPS